jgi:hypothetical protein
MAFELDFDESSSLQPQSRKTYGEIKITQAPQVDPLLTGPTEM